MTYARRQGLQEGKQEGLLEGRQEGLQEGLLQGETKGRQEILDLLKSGKSVEDIIRDYT
jgi:flagellar biosynthesis/type III secretory pathway protein FliH